MKVYIAEILIMPGEDDDKENACAYMEETLSNHGFKVGIVTLKDAEVVLCEEE